MTTSIRGRRLFSRGSWPEVRRIGEILRQEAVGGVLLLVAAAAALVWANSPASHGYASFISYRLGPDALHLKLTVAQWASDGLLAIFFFVAGLELKREFVAGDLRTAQVAAVPVAAACGGVIVPAVLFSCVNLAGGSAKGWAIPVATDIAFALAVLAVISTHLPSALRTFLLTLAVVDDLIAIVIIAIFYTKGLKPVALVLALIPIALFGVLVQRRVRAWWVLLPLAAVAWGLVHYSGVHATVAGVLLAFTVPVVRSERAGGPDAGPGMAEHLEHRWRPLSAGVAVPIFALTSAGVSVGGLSGLGATLSDRIAIGIAVGLLIGKPLGVFGATWLVARFTRAELDEDLTWADIFGLAVLCGVGFTVSLLIGELAYGAASVSDAHVKVGVLTGSAAAALVAGVVLRLRNRAYGRIAERETRDADAGSMAEASE